MDFIAAVSTLLVPPLVGFAILHRAGVRFSEDPLAGCGWSYVTGLVAVGCYMAAWLVLGLPLTRLISLPLLLLAIALLWIPRRPRPPATREMSRTPRTPLWYLGFVALVLGGALLIVIAGNHTAVMSSDEATIWARKAKMIYAAGGFGPGFDQLVAENTLPAEFFAPLIQWEEAILKFVPPEVAKFFPDLGRTPLSHLDYPILNPLTQLWSFVNSGEILHFENRFLVQGSTVAMLLILAGALRQVCGPLLAVALLSMFFALLETQTALFNANADGMVATGFLVAVDALRRWLREDRERNEWLGLFAIGLTMMIWSKNEGSMHLVAIVCGCAVARIPVLKPALPWLALPAAVLLFHWISNAVFGFQNDLMSRESGGGIERIPVLCEYMWNRIVTGPIWADNRNGVHSGFLFLGFFGLLFLGPASAFRAPRGFLTITLLAAMGSLMLVYLTTPHRLEWHLETSALRVTWQVLPTTILWLGMTSHEFLACSNRES